VRGGGEGDSTFRAAVGRGTVTFRAAVGRGQSLSAPRRFAWMRRRVKVTVPMRRVKRLPPLATEGRPKGHVPFAKSYVSPSSAPLLRAFAPSREPTFFLHAKPRRPRRREGGTVPRFSLRGGDGRFHARRREARGQSLSAPRRFAWMRRRVKVTVPMRRVKVTVPMRRVNPPIRASPSRPTSPGCGRNGGGRD
jgi:hypothetical protein